MEKVNFSEFSKYSSRVRLNGLTKQFASLDKDGKENIAVNNINVEVNDGEMVTLLGPSGCGKTTTLRMISGFENPTRGSIYIGDRDVTTVPPNKRNISMVFQSYALFPHLTIYENVAYGLKIKRLGKEEVKQRTDAAMLLMQLNGMETRYPNQLSGGQQQRVALARAIIIEPRVLLFDEPLSNLDAKLRETMRDELRALQKRLGITSLYVTHDQSEAMAISDKVIIMKDGDIMQMGSPKEVYEYPSNRFVANFIGKTNFLPCIYGGQGNGGAVVKINDLRYELPQPGDVNQLKPGQECALSIRPESIHLSSHNEDQGVPGIIKRITYFGVKIEYEVESGDGTTTMVEIYNPILNESFSEGDRVFMVFDRECARVLV